MAPSAYLPAFLVEQAPTPLHRVPSLRLHARRADREPTRTWKELEVTVPVPSAIQDTTPQRLGRQPVGRALHVHRAPILPSREQLQMKHVCHVAWATIPPQLVRRPLTCVRGVQQALGPVLWLPAPRARAPHAGLECTPL